MATLSAGSSSNHFPREANMFCFRDLKINQCDKIDASYLHSHSGSIAANWKRINWTRQSGKALDLSTHNFTTASPAPASDSLLADRPKRCFSNANGFR